MEQTLKGKTVLITGGSVGIGKCIAEKCAEAGAQVVITARTEKDLKDELAVLNQISPADHQFRVLDVGKREQVEAAAKWAKEKFGAIDGLVNNAGIYGPIGPIQSLDMKEFEDAHAINFLGTVYMCRYFVPLLEARKGRIINYSGGGAAGPFANYSAYATSKAAVVRFTENISQELSPLGIAANAVGPGFVATRLHQQTLKAGAGKAGEKFLESTKKEIEKGGVPPEKAANLTVFLLSSKSEGVTGKFLSAQWDPWEKPEFIEKLKKDKDFATLRRIDGMNFKGTKAP